jgi:hypothetical protein
MRQLPALITAFWLFAGFALPSLALPVTTLSETPAQNKEQGSGETPETEQSPDKHEEGDKASANVPEIITDLSRLPEPVRAMRQRILDSALSGETEKLRTAIEVNEMPPAFSFSEQGDPIAALKKNSNDGEGREIMAILAEVLEAGFIHMDKGTPQEMYIWPYFAHYPLDKLSPAQKVEMFRIVTAYEYNEMKEFGAYNFYRVGISPDGVWHFFVSGD